MLAYWPDDWDAQLDALSAAVDDLDRPWESSLLDPITVALDAVSWSKETENPDDLGKHDRRRMLAELKSSVARCGEEFGRLTETETAAVLAMNDLAAHNATEIIGEYLDKGTSGAAAAAAWDDLVLAAAALPKGVESEFVGCRNLLGRVVRQMDFDLGFGGSSTTADGVLKNSTTSIIEALRHVDREDEASELEARLISDRTTSSSYTKESRIELVRLFWSTVGPSGKSVVWLKIEYAKLGDHNPVKVGPIELHSADALVLRLENQEREERVPEEIWSARDRLASWLPPNEQGHVLARVSIEGRLSTCIDHSLQLVEAIISLYRGRNDRGWVTSGSAAHFVDGKLRSTRFGRIESRERDIDLTWELGDVLRSQAAKFVPAALTLSSGLLKASRAAAQMHGRTAREPDDVVVSSVRVLEEFRRDVFPLDGDWSITATRIGRSHWAFTRSYRAVEHAVRGVATSTATHWLLEPAVQSRYEELSSQLLTRMHERDPELGLAEVGRIGIELYSMLRPEWLQAARLKSALRLTSNDGNVSRRPINQWIAAFDRYLLRLGRVRNSLQHGRAVDELTVSNVEDFAFQVGHLAAMIRAESVLRPEPIVDAAAARHEIASQAIYWARLGYWEVALSNPE